MYFFFLNSMFWLEDYRVLFEKHNYIYFIPTKQMTLNEKLNSIMRLNIYYTILVFCFIKEKNWLILPILSTAVIVLIYYKKKKEMLIPLKQNKPNIELEAGFYDFDDKLRVGKYNPILANNENVNIRDTVRNDQSCRKPTINNPFMNIHVPDFNNGQMPKACNVDDSKIEHKVQAYYNKNLFKNIDDVFDSENTFRQFYTMPVTTIPNKQPEFANWLYKIGETCKENTTKCNTYQDVRYRQAGE